ncbi:MAG: indole-3-glycerol phosphate synthase TrpC [Planctomycetes bacterium]|nr:indole-3-glycerol phosphate synthase TrpC [Planctomycetota bacterium]
MATILDRIVQTKRDELARSMRDRPLAEVMRQAQTAPPPRDFVKAVTGSSPHGINLIAEIKRKSPSAGVIRPDLDPVEIACTYHQAGAASLSILTDRTYFDGRLEYIEEVKAAVPLPVLRKDFTIDPYQIYETRAAGADAVLLIAEILDPDQISEMVNLAAACSLGVLIEFHSAETLAKVFAAVTRTPPPHCILGINNRDLHRQQTDIAATARLAAKLEPGTPFVSESGIKTRADVEAVQSAGACAILVGESILERVDADAAIKILLGQSRER